MLCELLCSIQGTLRNLFFKGSEMCMVVKNWCPIVSKYSLQFALLGHCHCMHMHGQYSVVAKNHRNSTAFMLNLLHTRIFHKLMVSNNLPLSILNPHIPLQPEGSCDPWVLNVQQISFLAEVSQEGHQLHVSILKHLVGRCPGLCKQDQVHCN